MSFIKNDQVFHWITEQELAEIIAYNLRKDHGHQGSSVKSIARMISLNPRIVRNWYEAKHAPNLSNFLRLMSCSPSLTKQFLELIKHIQKSEHFAGSASNDITTNNRIYSDNSVTVNVILNRKILLKLNQRQLWFYGFLQKGISFKAEDIANIWDINIRTAKRDISGLTEMGLIKFVGGSKNGRYVLKE